MQNESVTRCYGSRPTRATQGLEGTRIRCAIVHNSSKHRVQAANTNPSKRRPSAGMSSDQDRMEYETSEGYEKRLKTEDSPTWTMDKYGVPTYRPVQFWGEADKKPMKEYLRAADDPRVPDEMKAMMKELMKRYEDEKDLREAAEDRENELQTYKEFALALGQDEDRKPLTSY